MTTVLELVQSAADELSLARPSDIVDTTEDNTAQKLIRHLTRTCKQLSSEYDWVRLRREKTFTTVAAAEQTGAVPVDFQRFVKDTIWNRTTRARIYGPIPVSEWQARQAIVISGPCSNFVMRGTSFLISPTPSAGWTVAYEYITKYIGVAVDGATERTTFTADDDETYFDDELVILGVVWRYRKAEGLDYSEEFREYQMRRANMIKMDGGRRVLNMGDEQDGPPRAMGGSLTTATSLEDIFTV
jgi:hypothetical protein